MGKSEATELSLKYQLVSLFTNYIVVADRNGDKQGAKLPALRKVPQMMAAGWGAVGSVKLANSPAGASPTFYKSLSGRFSIEETDDDLPFSDSVPRDLEKPPRAFIVRCNHLHENCVEPALQMITYSDLSRCALPDRILATLKNIAKNYDPEPTEQTIVLAFLMALAQSTVGQLFGRATRRVIQKASQSLQPTEHLIRSMVSAFADIRADDWGK